MEHDLTATRTSGSPTSLPAVPTSFGSGRYVVVRFIGRGGQKDVLLGRDTRLDRDVAIALTHHTLGPTAMIELRREAQAMAKLSNNPHVVSIYDIGEEQGQTFIVSQYVDGGSVAEWLKTKQQPLPIPTIIAMGTSVARALVEAHSCGIVHRDVKPGNIWMLGNQAFRLGDFGLASGTEPSLTRAERILRGTLVYMAPELFGNQPATPASDVYAIGVTLYQAATGALPFRGDQAFGIIWQHLHVQPVAPSWLNREVPAALERIILRLMAKDPDARMTALELADMLDQLGITLRPGSQLRGDRRRSYACSSRARRIRRTAARAQFAATRVGRNTAHRRTSHVYCRGGGIWQNPARRTTNRIRQADWRVGGQRQLRRSERGPALSGRGCKSFVRFCQRWTKRGSGDCSAASLVRLAPSCLRSGTSSRTRLSLLSWSPNRRAFASLTA